MNREQERRARNEILFREVNERIEEVASGLADPDGGDAPVGFVCECGREDCTEQLEATRAQYEAVRASPRRFLVLPGHEPTEGARVVERNPGFLVVEKVGEAAEISEDHDPRP